jgi:RecJ-like exonuclease
MRVFFFLSLVAFLITGIGSVSGCGSGEKFGKEITETKVTKIEDILAEPDKYIGKTVKIEGKIIQECPSGCWFYLKDQTGTIYVDLKPSGLAIPQSVGKKVAAEGKVKSSERLEIIGKGVEIE